MMRQTVLLASLAMTALFSVPAAAADPVYADLSEFSACVAPVSTCVCVPSVTLCCPRWPDIIDPEQIPCLRP